MTSTVIFQIDGGLGKSIAGTAVLKALRKAYKKSQIIVVTAYPDVFINNPNVNKVLRSGQTIGIYKNYISGKAAKIFIADPYHTSDFITCEKHLLRIWCELYGLEYGGEQPEIFISKAEKEHFAPYYKFDKPILAIHPNGGAETQPLKYSWTRDIPAATIKEVVSYFKADYAILHIRRRDQTPYEHTIGALDSWRSIAVMLMLSEKRLLIDSSTMHICGALNLKSVVAWVGTSPDVFGYAQNTNILANAPTKVINVDHGHYSKNLFFEDISTFPYDGLGDVFDAQKIIKALR